MRPRRQPRTVPGLAGSSHVARLARVCGGPTATSHLTKLGDIGAWTRPRRVAIALVGDTGCPLQRTVRTDAAPYSQKPICPGPTLEASRRFSGKPLSFRPNRCRLKRLLFLEPLPVLGVPGAGLERSSGIRLSHGSIFPKIP